MTILNCLLRRRLRISSIILVGILIRFRASSRLVKLTKSKTLKILKEAIHNSSFKLLVVSIVLEIIEIGSIVL